MQQNIAKSTMDPAVDYFYQYFCLVWWVWFGKLGWLSLVWFGRFALACLVWFGRFGLVWFCRFG